MSQRLRNSSYWNELVEEMRQMVKDGKAKFVDGKIDSLPVDAETEKLIPFESTDTFLNTYEWRKVRMEALKKYGPRCQCCGASPSDGVRMHVDHIKPRKLFPGLALSIDNLQILCEECNHGKGNWDMTDWRDRS